MTIIPRPGNLNAMPQPSLKVKVDKFDGPEAIDELDGASPSEDAAETGLPPSPSPTIQALDESVLAQPGDSEDVIKSKRKERDRRTRSVSSSSNAPVRAKSGGPAFHKPGCKCNPCASRRRKAEALATGTGVDTGPDISKVPTSGTLNADLPILHAADRSARTRIAQWIAIRSVEPNITNREIAKRLGITDRHLNSVISRATREGWLKFDDPLARLEYEVLPKVIDNLNYFIKKKDKHVTVETAKGTLFKQFAESKGVSEHPNNTLVIRVELPDRPSDAPNLPILEGSIVGRPKLLTE